MSDFYQEILDIVGGYLEVYFRLDELPDLLVEARAFMLCAISHEDHEIGWTFWDIDARDDIVHLLRFVERMDFPDMARDLRDTLSDLDALGRADVDMFFARTLEDRHQSKAIQDVLSARFHYPQFVENHDADVWEQIAKAGHKLIERDRPFQYHASRDDAISAKIRMIEALPDYEDRSGLCPGRERMVPVHSLLVAAGERYLWMYPAKTTLPSGEARIDPGNEDLLDLTDFAAADLVYRVKSTKGERMACRIGDLFWLVDPVSQERLASTAALQSQGGATQAP